METNKWKTTEEELPPNPRVDQIESMVKTIRETNVGLRKEVDTLKEKEKKEKDAGEI